MARQKGIIQLKGVLDQLVFYERNGVPVVRRKGSVDRERIRQDAAFARTREDNAEFGGASMAGKMLRTGLAPLLLFVNDATLTGRLTGLLRKAAQAGPGERGRRKIEILAQRDRLTGFELDKGHPFGTVFTVPCPAPVITPQGDGMQWTLPAFVPADAVHAPEGATHFKLLLAVLAVSDYVHDAEAGTYMPEHAAVNGLYAAADTGLLALTDPMIPSLVLTADLNLPAILPAGTGLIAAAGIGFYQEVNGEYYRLKGGGGRF